MPRRKRPRPQTPDSESTQDMSNREETGSGRPTRRSRRAEPDGDAAQSGAPSAGASRSPGAEVHDVDDVAGDASDAGSEEAAEGGQGSWIGQRHLVSNVRAIARALGFSIGDSDGEGGGGEEDDEDDGEWIDEESDDPEGSGDESADSDDESEAQGEDEEMAGPDYEDFDDEDEDDDFQFSYLSGVRRLLQRQREKPEQKLIKYPRFDTLEETNIKGLKQFVGTWDIQCVFMWRKSCWRFKELIDRRSATVISTARRSEASSYSNRTGTVVISSASSNYTGTMSIEGLFPAPHPQSQTSVTRLSSFSYDPRLGLAHFSWTFEDSPMDRRAVQKTVYDDDAAEHDQKVRAAVEKGHGVAWLCVPTGAVDVPFLALLLETGEKPADVELPALASKKPHEYGLRPALPVGSLARSPGLKSGLRVSVLAALEDS